MFNIGFSYISYGHWWNRLAISNKSVLLLSLFFFRFNQTQNSSSGKGGYVQWKKKREKGWLPTSSTKDMLWIMDTTSQYLSSNIRLFLSIHMHHKTANITLSQAGEILDDTRLQRHWHQRLVIKQGHWTRLYYGRKWSHTCLPYGERRRIWFVVQ